VATVIDALIVTLGLDTKGFKKGTDDAKKRTKDTQDVVKKSSVDISKNLTNAAASFAKLFLGFEGLSGAARQLIDLNKAAADLGRSAANVGTTTHSLQVAGNAVELVGGVASDAAAAFALWSKSITDLKVDKVLSPLLQLARIRLGIATEDSTGKVREFGDVAEDIADKLAGYSRADAHNILQKAGFQEGYINYLLLEKSARAEIIRQAEAQAKLTNAASREAAEVQSQWEGVKQQIKASKQEIATGLIPAEKTALGLLSGGLEIISNSVKVLGKTLSGLFSGLTDIPFVKRFLAWNDKTIKARDNFFSELSASLRGAAMPDTVTAPPPDTGSPTADNRVPHAQGTIAEPVPSGATATRGIRNNNIGNLRESFGEHDAQGFSIFRTQAEGVARLSKQIDLDAARNLTLAQFIAKYAPASDHNNVQAYVGALTQATGARSTDQLSTIDKAALIKAIAVHESGKAAGAIAGSLYQPVPNALAAAQGNGPTPGANQKAGTQDSSRTTNNNATVENLNVYTQATDPNGIAAALPAAIARKGLIAQADTGQS
jgi:hypothetical protein